MFLLVAAALLVLSIATSPPVPVYDEFSHIQNALKIPREGLKATLTSPENQSAVGPLHATFLLASAPLTHLKLPALRWVNMGVFFLLMAVLAWSAGSGSSRQEALLKAGSLLAVSFAWPCTGLVLTEMPALLFFTGFILVLRKALSCPAHGQYGALAAGILLGVAILGRQTYLVAPVALALMALWDSGHRKHYAVCLAACLSVCGWLFFWWKGFVPPSQTFVDGGLQPFHVVLAMAHLGAVAFFLSPGWLLPTSALPKWAVSAGILVFAALFLYSASLPAKSLLARFDRPFPVASVLAALFMGGLGFLWLLRIVETALQNRFQPEILLCILLLLVLAAAPAKISHTFSSRYVVGAMTLQWLLVEKTLHFDWKNSSIRLAGSAAGFGILQCYYGNLP